MKIFEKIAEFFRKKEFYSLDDFQIENYEIRFKELNDQILLNIGNYIKKNIQESKSIEDSKDKLFKRHAKCCNSLDELLPLIKSAVEQDYKDTVVESLENNWDFQYYLNEYFLNDKTICIHNVLSSSIDEKIGSCIYPILSIKKFNGEYYFWLHLE